MKAVSTLAIVAMATLAITALSANADLVSQYGILDLMTNGGLNPNTGVAWVAGDQYRLAFHTDETINATSNDPGVYDDFATAQAQQNSALVASSGWTAMVYVNTDNTLAPGVSPVSSPLVRSGTDDQTDGAAQGGAGVPVYAMDGTTSIARNNADIYNGWSNPFDGDATLRLASGSTNQDSEGNDVVASQNVFYSPFLDQFGLGDTANVHGPAVWTGGFGSHVNAAGDTPDNTTTSHGNSNANNWARVWNRFNRNNVDLKSLYAISDLLTVVSEGLIGDADENGVVNAADYMALKRHMGMGSGAGLADGDFDANSSVNYDDLQLLIGNYGATSAGSGMVPEPATLFVMMVAGLPALLKRRRSPS